jgi:hypothetical protein
MKLFTFIISIIYLIFDISVLALLYYFYENIFIYQILGIIAGIVFYFDNLINPSSEFKLTFNSIIVKLKNQYPEFDENYIINVLKFYTFIITIFKYWIFWPELFVKSIIVAIITKPVIIKE